MKRRLVLIGLFLGFIFSFIVMVQAVKLEVSTKEENYGVGDKINIKVSLLDDNGNTISDDVQVIMKDAESRKEIVKTISSNNFIDVDLGEGATFGFWTITANYKGDEATGTFFIEQNELAKFELHDDQLSITNIGNSRYKRSVQIVIGDTVGVKEPNLEIGESVTFRLIAPEGVYNVKITDGKTSISRGNVQLTGNVIGILDESISRGIFRTGAVQPIDESNANLGYDSIMKNKFVYLFILTVIGAAVLLALERKYGKIARNVKVGKRIKLKGKK